MRRKYPNADKMKTLLCEQVRPEMNKKMSFLGVYAGDHIVFHPKTPGALPYRLQALAFVFIFKDAIGEFKAEFTLDDPAGETLYKAELEPVVAQKNRTVASIIQIGNIAFEAEGVYRATLQLERKKYAFDFTVSSSPAERAA